MIGLPYDSADDRLRDHYQAQSLDAAALERLRAIVQDPDLRQPDLPVRPSRVRGWLLFVASLAAVVAAAVGLGIGLELGPWSRPPVAQVDPTLAVAEDVARVHGEDHELELLPPPMPDQPSIRIAELTARLSLPFAAVEPDRLGGEYHVQGAHLCTVGGRPALEVRLIDRHHHLVTLYQLTDLDDADLGDDDLLRAGVDHSVDGLHVRLWREGSFVLAMVWFEDLG
jgi:hypothetical protein